MGRVVLNNGASVSLYVASCLGPSFNRAELSLVRVVRNSTALDLTWIVAKIMGLDLSWRLGIVY